jgi:hypothetical protein
MDMTQLHKQWAERPSDQRFVSMQELHAFNVSKRERSAERGVALDHMRVVPTDAGGMLLRDPQKPNAAFLTHWAFGQLCGHAKAPASYLRSLPAQLAAVPLQWSLEHQREDAKLLLRKTDEGWSVAGITSDSYGRIFDAEMSQAVLDNVDLNVWKIPSASYASTNPRKATTLYASDRDCFICLVDDQHPIEVPGTNGVERLYRGFICRNSEVGAATYVLETFLYRSICDNRNIWGGREVASLKIRHTSGGPMRFMREAKPTLERYLTAGTEDTVQAIRAAQDREVGRSEKDVVAWLKARGFTGTESKRAVELAGSEDGLNPRSLWGVVQGLTAQAHEIPFGDERLDLERRAGKLMDAVL